VATTRYWYGELLLRLGRAADRERGMQLVTRAREIAERTGMQDIAQRCADLQRAREPDSDPFLPRT
jgi:hypothetical protein